MAFDVTSVSQFLEKSQGVILRKQIHRALQPQQKIERISIQQRAHR